MFSAPSRKGGGFSRLFHLFRDGLLDRYAECNEDFVLVVHGLSGDLQANGGEELIQVIGYTLIEQVELRAFLAL